MGGGKSYILYSSAVTSNTPADEKFDVRGFGVVTVIIAVHTITSGCTITPNINAYPVAIEGQAESLSYPIIASGTVTIGSGYAARYKLSDAYDRIGIGIMNSTANKSGRVTVTATGKRRQ